MWVTVFNNSGGALGVITWPGSWMFAGFTWANPAASKRRTIALVYDPNVGKWVVTSIFLADF